jgi:hypothetical protein
MWLAMLASRRVQAGISQAEPLDRLAADNVRLNDLFDVCFGDVSVPNRIRVDHYVGPVFTLIQAAGLVRADFALQAVRGQGLLEELLQPCLGERVTAPARMARWALISADEDMLFELGHQATAAT